MRHQTFYLTLLLVFSWTGTCFSQTSARVSKPELSLDNNHLIINYDIFAAQPEDTFREWVEITDAHNKKIHALALSGDVGDQVPGGTGKKIRWDFTEDQVDPETEISLQVYAELQQTPEKGPVVESGSGSESKEMYSAEKYSAGKSLYKSVLFPGLGFTSMDQSRFHFAKRVACYGLVASSMVFNRLAVNNRANYLAEINDEEQRDDYYDTCIRQDILSKVFACSAIGIWTAEIVWLLIEVKAKNRISRNFPVRVAPGYDPFLGAPTLCLSYQF